MTRSSVLDECDSPAGNTAFRQGIRQVEPEHLRPPTLRRMHHMQHRCRRCARRPAIPGWPTLLALSPHATRIMPLGSHLATRGVSLTPLVGDAAMCRGSRRKRRRRVPRRALGRWHGPSLRTQAGGARHLRGPRDRWPGRRPRPSGDAARSDHHTSCIGSRTAPRPQPTRHDDSVTAGHRAHPAGDEAPVGRSGAPSGVEGRRAAPGKSLRAVTDSVSHTFTHDDVTLRGGHPWVKTGTLPPRRSGEPAGEQPAARPSGRR